MVNRSACGDIILLTRGDDALPACDSEGRNDRVCPAILDRFRANASKSNAEAEMTHMAMVGAAAQRVVLVFQGGGALGAYQAGVYHALHEAGIEPDWIIGTSIGAINA